jgi:hypothetical protein
LVFRVSKIQIRVWVQDSKIKKKTGFGSGFGLGFAKTMKTLTKFPYKNHFLIFGEVFKNIKTKLLKLLDSGTAWI